MTKRATARSLLLAAAFSLAAAGPAAAASGAVLRGLDKISGQAKDFVAPIGKTVRFGSLDIVARACSKSPPEERPEVSIFLEVTDHPVASVGQPAQTAKKIFSGWIFASSPALNALEHPVYDVWAIDCSN